MRNANAFKNVIKLRQVIGLRVSPLIFQSKQANDPLLKTLVRRHFVI